MIDWVEAPLTSTSWVIRQRKDFVKMFTEYDKRRDKNFLETFPLASVPLMVVALLGTGVYMTFKLGFPQLKHILHGMRVTRGDYDNVEDEGDLNHFRALSTALAATVGIGNIAGVAIAIYYGGPGALFWISIKICRMYISPSIQRNRSAWKYCWWSYVHY